MTSALLRLSLAAEETCGTALFGMHSLPGRVSHTRLRRFPSVDFARDPTTISVHLAFAVTNVTSFLGVRCGFESRDISLSSACKTTHALQKFPGPVRFRRQK